MGISHMGHAKIFDISPAPTPTGGAQILDQVIACFLMLVALVITYMLH